MANYLKGNDPIGDTPIFDWTTELWEEVGQKHVDFLVESQDFHPVFGSRLLTPGKSP